MAPLSDSLIGHHIAIRIIAPEGGQVSEKKLKDMNKMNFITLPDCVAQITAMIYSPVKKQLLVFEQHKGDLSGCYMTQYNLSNIDAPRVASAPNKKDEPKQHIDITSLAANIGGSDDKDKRRKELEMYKSEAANMLANVNTSGAPKANSALHKT